jgi:glycosyltransferase involved in cell wall biosynthesis
MSFRIAVDSFRLVGEPRSSISVYVSELATSLATVAQVEKLYLLVPRKPGSDFQYSGLSAIGNVQFIYPERPHFPEKSFASQVSWVQWQIPRLIRTIDKPIDYFVAPYHHPPLHLSRKVRVVTVIHDLCGLEKDSGYPKTSKWFYRHLLMFLLAFLRSDRLIPISNYTRTRLIERFPFVSHRVSEVVYNCISSRPVEKEAVQNALKKHGLFGRPYFMSIGLLGRRKGLDLILDSYCRYRATEGHSLLVLVVPSGLKERVEQLASAHGIKDLIMLSELDLSDRDALYNGALALLFPSRCEGFGYPIVEAMRQGCPPIAWRQGPAREITADTVPLLETLDTQNIANMMHLYEELDSNDRVTLASQLSKRSYVFQTGPASLGHQFVQAIQGTGNGGGFTRQTPVEFRESG